MRLFVALEIPAAVRDRLGALLGDLRAAATSAGDKRPRWVRPENLHVTLKFIGEAAPEKLEALRGALTAVRCAAAVEMSFRGLGFFPSEKRPRVFWAGILGPESLSRLAHDIDDALAALGIPRETRPFSPHLTLARFEPPGLHEKLRVAIAQEGAREFGSCRAREFHLIESKTKPSGAEYTVLHSFPFGAEA